MLLLPPKNFIRGVNNMKNKIYRVSAVMAVIMLLVVTFVPFTASAAVTTDSSLLDIHKRFSTGLRITTPLNGFKQSKTDMVSITFFFKIKATEDVQYSDLKSRISGFVGIMDTDFGRFGYVGDGYAVGFFSVFGKTGYGPGQLLVSVTDQFGVLHSDYVNFTNFEGWLDADGDGKDDRVGRDPDEIPSDPNMPEQPPPDDTGDDGPVTHAQLNADGSVRSSMLLDNFRPLVELSHGVLLKYINKTQPVEANAVHIAYWFDRPMTLTHYGPDSRGRLFHFSVVGDGEFNYYRIDANYNHNYTPPEFYAPTMSVSGNIQSGDYFRNAEYTSVLQQLTNVSDYEFVGYEVVGDVAIVGEDNKPKEWLGPSAFDASYRYLEEGVTITSPRNGFTQSQIDDVVVYFNFKLRCSPTATQDSFSYDVRGYLPNTGMLETWTFAAKDGWAVCNASMSGNTGFGENKTITVQVIDEYGQVWKDSIMVSCYQEFVDLDDDGRDDRAGDDYWAPAHNKDSPWGGGGGGIGSYDFDLTSAVGSITSFMQSLYAVIPPQILSIVIAGLGFLLLLGIKRLVL